LINKEIFLTLQPIEGAKLSFSPTLQNSSYIHKAKLIDLAGIYKKSPALMAGPEYLKPSN
jgi:hypothetical protein